MYQGFRSNEKRIVSAYYATNQPGVEMLGVTRVDAEGEVTVSQLSLDTLVS